MTHPEDQLAAFVDGTLSSSERAHVEEHLRHCTACRAEVDAAATAREALRALPELIAPEGLGKRAAKAAGSRDGRPGRFTHAAVANRWIGAGIAAAAAILAVFVMTQHRPSEHPAAQSGATAIAGPARLAEAARNPGDFTGEELQQLAFAERARYTGEKREGQATRESLTAAGAGPETEQDAEGEPASTSESDDTAHAPPAGSSSPAAVKAAFDYAGLDRLPLGGEPERCLRQSGAFDAGGRLLRIYQARAAGIPAYFGTLVRGAERGDDADRIVVWVAQKSSCMPVGFAQAYLDYPSPSPDSGFEWPVASPERE